MAILTRLSKGTALTHTEMDSNFKELDYRLHILASAPGITTDIDDGVLVGSHCYVTSTEKMYINTDNTAGAAVWEEQIEARDYYVSSTDPVNNTDDITLGYKLGSHWYNEATGMLYIATLMGTGTSTWELQQKADYTMDSNASGASDVYEIVLPVAQIPADSQYQVNIKLKGLVEDLVTATGVYFPFEENFTVLVPIDLAASSTATYTVKTSSGIARPVTLTRDVSNNLTISTTFVNGGLIDDQAVVGSSYLEMTYDYAPWTATQSITIALLSVATF